MQLKHLTAYGFKSFADRTDIDFGRGVTAIVGPNGSGKSNITDAIRWVLGEQNVRNLRGQKSEDIIFTGSNQRRQLGAAEVSLTFDNSDGRLPVEYAEVIITRRIFRSGESEVYINKKPCRLKDIYDLLADTGVGREGISIISQNKIDEILNCKPEERRLFLEEAAGITKYRSRRREATRKLEDTEKNLERVRDIIGEIATRLEPMEREAERTKKYNKLSREYTGTKIAGLVQQYRQQEKLFFERQNKLTAIRDEETAVITKKNILAVKKQQAEKDYLELDNACNEKNDEIQTLTGKIKDKESDIRLFEEKKRSQEAEEARLVDETKDLFERVGVAQKNGDDLRAVLSQHEQEQKNSAEKFARLQAEAKRLSDGVQSLRSEIAARRKEVEFLQQAVIAQENELALLIKDIDSDTERRAQNKDSQRLLEETLTKVEQDLANIQKSKKINTETINQCKHDQRNAAETLRRLNGKAATVKQDLAVTGQFIAQAEARLDVLRGLQASYEGFGRAPKAVLSCREPWRNRIAGAVAELLQIPAKFTTAIEVALGGALQYIVCDDTDSAKCAIDYLKAGRFGRATFLPLASLSERQPLNLASGVKEMSGFLGLGHELVKTEKQYDKISRFLLAQTVVVDTYSRAKAIAKRLNYKVRIVTLDGELFFPGGSLAGGSLHKTESGFLSRRTEIEELTTCLSEKKARYNELCQNEKQLAVEINNQLTVQENAGKKIQELTINQTELNVRADNLDVEKARIIEELDDLKAYILQMSLDYAQAQQKKTTVQNDLQRLKAEAAAISEKINESEGQLFEAEASAEEKSAEIHAEEMAMAIRKQKSLAVKERIMLIAHDIESFQEQIAQCEAKIKQLEELKRLQADEKSDIADILSEMNNKLFSLEQEKQRLFSLRMEKAVESQDIDKEIQLQSNKLLSIGHAIQQQELALNKLQLTMDDITGNLGENYRLTLSAAADYAADIPEKEIDSLLISLKNQIDLLGAINPRAIEEYDEQRQRYDLMTGQAIDLDKARGDLLDIVNEIDGKMTERLTKAYAEIRKYFGETFATLFGGGEADLVMTRPEEILASGLDILVTLPDKKRQNLSALSGGERALTVIALLFAVLRYSPSPFTVLDEIDAPLDEANIARFGMYLKNIARNTQFIIVTHRKGTMNSADTLYGVALEDAGVSKIISVKLDEICA